MQSGTGKLPPLRPVPEPRVTMADFVRFAALRIENHLFAGFGKYNTARHLLKRRRPVE